MAYCRCGEDSDVYVWCGRFYEIHFGEGIPGVTEKMKQTGFHDQSFEDGKQALEFMEKVKDAGFKIPEHALERLKWELGLPSHYQEFLDSISEEEE
jgi:hypothetical protein